MKLTLFIFSLLFIGGFFIFFTQKDTEPMLLTKTEIPSKKIVKISTPTPKIALEKKVMLSNKKSTPRIQNALLNELEKLLQCETTNTCPQDNSDPRASDFLKSKQIIQKLTKIREAYHKKTITSTQLEKSALKLLNYPDSAVVEKSLELLAQVPPKKRFKKAVLEMFSTSYDAKLVMPILLELNRHPNNEENIKIFSNILQHGSFYVAQELASKISPFINENNLKRYDELLTKLPLHSKKRDNLNASLKEFKTNH